MCDQACVCVCVYTHVGYVKQVYFNDTHQSLELSEGDRGAVEEVGRQPSFVLVTVTNGCA